MRWMREVRPSIVSAKYTLVHKQLCSYRNVVMGSGQPHAYHNSFLTSNYFSILVVVVTFIWPVYLFVVTILVSLSSRRSPFI